MFGHVIERHASGDDAADQQDVAPARVEFAGEDDLRLAAVTVAADFHKAATERHVERANQISQENKSVVEHADDRKVAHGHMAANVGGELTNAVLDFLLGANDLKI